MGELFAYMTAWAITSGVIAIEHARHPASLTGILIVVLVSFTIAFLLGGRAGVWSDFWVVLLVLSVLILAAMLLPYVE